MNTKWDSIARWSIPVRTSIASSDSNKMYGFNIDDTLVGYYVITVMFVNDYH